MKHRDELTVTMEHFSRAFEKVKTSSYQSATIYWDGQKSGNVV